MTKLIAEIGWNFLGNINLAKEMISTAKESGADYAKFQTWSTKDLVRGPWHKDNGLIFIKKLNFQKMIIMNLMNFVKKRKLFF